MRGSSLILIPRTRPHNTMWSHFAFLLIVGAAVAVAAEHEYAWKPLHQYEYHLKSWTTTRMTHYKRTICGIVMNSVLTITVATPMKLIGKITDAQHAHLNKMAPAPNFKKFPDIPEHNLQLIDTPISEESFVVELSNGVIQQINTHPKMSAWNVNLVKGIMSQLQVTMKDDVLTSQSESESSDNMWQYTTKESSVTGDCDVSYELSLQIPPPHIKHVHLPHESSDDQAKSWLQIAKSKNYKSCIVRSAHHFGVPLSSENDFNEKENLVTQYSHTHIVATGNTKDFTIQHSMTLHGIQVKHKNNVNLNSQVLSAMNLTLINVKKLSPPIMHDTMVEHLASTGNLVYLQTIYDMHLNSSDIVKKRRRLSIGDPPQQASGMNMHAEMNYFMIPSTHLDETPNNMLIPFLSFDPKRIKSLLTDESKMVQKAMNLIKDIEEQIKNPNNIVSHEMLEKHLILGKLISLMNIQHITALVNKVRPHSTLKADQYHKWAILRDAIAQAGTGPAFLAIADLIKADKIHGLDAVKVISQLPKVIRVPSREYVREFYNFVQSVNIKNDRQMEITAAMSFGELLRNLILKEKFHPAEDVTGDVKLSIIDINKVYIPYLNKKLHEAMLKHNGPMIQTYISAMARTGQPTIVPIFKAYLGDKLITKFQRLVILASLATLSKIQPVLARQILVPIYANEKESHEARCIAVHLIIMSNPPLLTLQRMARFTNIDSNEQVNSVVKSSIETLANLYDPKWHDISMKARIAKKLLSREGHSAMHSKGSYHELFIDKILRGFNVKTVGSNDYDIPKAAYFGLSSIFDRLEQTTFQSRYAVSSIKQLVKTLLQEGSRFYPENDEIAKKINFKEDKISPIEGNVFVNTLYGSYFHPFDGDTAGHDKMQLMYLMLEPKLTSSLLHFHNFDVETAFPMENGLPFFYKVNSPLLTHLNIDKEIDEENKELNSLNMTGKINAIIAHKMQSRSGFVTPFDMHEYVNSVDSHLFIRLPIAFEFDVHLPNKNLIVGAKLTMDASKDDPKTKLFHYDNIATISHKHALDLKPLSLGAEKRMILPNVKKTNITIGAKSIEVHMKKNGKVKDMNLLPYLMNKIQSPPKRDCYEQFEINLDSSMAHEKIIDVLVTHNAIKTKSLPASETKKGIFGKSIIPVIVDSKVNSEKRKKQFQMELSKDIKSADTHVLDISLELPIIPTLKHTRQAITLGMGGSKVDSQLQILAYWNIQGLDQIVHHEYCVGVDMLSSQSMPLNTELISEQLPDHIIELEVQHGDTCKKGQKEHFQFKKVQSSSLEYDLINSDVYQRCRDEMAEGNKGLLACQKVNEFAEKRDMVFLSLQHVNPTVSMINSDIVNYIKSLPLSKKLGLRDPNVDENADMVLDQTHLIDTSLDALRDIILPSVLQSFKTPFDLPESSVALEYNNIVDAAVEQNPSNFWCAIDNTKVITLDGRIFPLHLGNCWHVVLISHPEHSLIVETREQGAQRELKIHLGAEKFIHMYTSDSGIKVKVNEEKVAISQHENYKDVDDELQQAIIEILVLPDETISFISEKYGIQGAYNGKSILIHLSNKHRASVRGLCGDFSQDTKSDFITPDKCTAKGSKDLIDSFTVPEKNCPRKEVAKVCVPSEKTLTEGIYHWENIELDYDREEKSHKFMTHVTKILETDHQICFSVRPVPMCVEDAVPKRTRNKLIKFHCALRTKEIVEIMKRVKKGAHPDMKDKTVHKVQNHSIPVTCMEV